MVQLNNNRTYNILGLKPNEYNLLRSIIENEAQATRGYNNSDNSLLKGLCNCIGATYHDQLDWAEIEENEIPN
jgi:hypothetical protein